MTPSMKSCIDHNLNILKILIEVSIKVKKKKDNNAEITFVIKRTFYLQKVEAPRVTLVNSQRKFCANMWKKN